MITVKEESFVWKMKLNIMINKEVRQNKRVNKVSRQNINKFELNKNQLRRSDSPVQEVNQQKDLNAGNK